MKNLIIGLMSGTSLDGVDAVLVDLNTQPFELIATHSLPMPTDLRLLIQTLQSPQANEIEHLIQAHQGFAQLYHQACSELLSQTARTPDHVSAIGCHGQTVRHCPHHNTPYTLQVGDPHLLAKLTEITVVADFRPRDIFYGGQGAPLAPGFHQAAFRSNAHNRVILNIGGIANLTVLPADPKQHVIGFDTGPGNCLLDAWINQHLGHTFDTDGQWAQSGQCQNNLLEQLMADPYFNSTFPKSTGTDYFNLNWLHTHLKNPTEYEPVDLQRTLLELTVQSIHAGIQALALPIDEVFVCGGGAKNQYLMKRLSGILEPCPVSSTAQLGIDPQWVEAMAFAWLAQQTLSGRPGNLPSVTGAERETVLGAIYPANSL